VVTQEYDFDLCSGFVERGEAVQMFMSSNRCIPVKNALG
jgi:hypothetical protein